MSNGFHTSLAFRTRDLPYAREISGDSQSSALLIGWGGGDFYRGHANPWTFLKAMIGVGPSVIHVVPMRVSVAERFRQSDVVRFDLSVEHHRNLVAEMDRAFARDERGARVALGRGYFAQSRFYEGRAKFYFPKMCNTWVALKLRHAGVPIFVPTAIIAGNLSWQAAKTGRRQQTLKKPADGF